MQISSPSIFNPSYISPRTDLVPVLARTILDVGCSTGSLGALLKQRQRASVTGIELSSEMAAVARGRLDHLHEGDAAAILLGNELIGQRYDTIIFADVLEHLVDPWSVLRRAVQLLEPGGTVVASTPNIRHWDTVFSLVVSGRWPVRERGIHDRTHLRFFTKADAIDLMEGSGLVVDEMRTHFRLFERPHAWNDYARYLAWPGLREFLAFQYLFRARRAV